MRSAISIIMGNYWNAIDVNIKSALIGALSALLVAYLTDWQERKRNEDQQKSTEISKLKYLYFLMEDTFVLVNSYSVDTQKFIDSLNENPFVVPSSQLHSPHSLNTISNKLNQEDYYLASVNRLGDADLPHIFLMYNNLDDTFTKATAHFRSEFPELLTTKDNYETALEGLMRLTREYVSYLNTKPRSAKEEEIFRRINAEVTLIKPKLNSIAERDQWLKDSKVVFVDKLVNILPEGVNVNLDANIRDVSTRYNLHVSRMSNVVGSMVMNRNLINDLAAKITHYGKPLHTFIKGQQ